MSLTISIFSDVICPWCFVGKRRLERALDELGLGATARIEWLPFELNPDMPVGGMERASYRTRKFGAERAASLDDSMRETGRQEGIPFAFDRMLRTPNTRLAHILIAHAERQGRSGPLVEALFRAYFEQGRDIGDADVLTDIARSVGLDLDGAKAALGDPALAAHVVATEAQAAEIGVSGVPFFIVDRSWAMSGAQPSDQWVAALRQRLGAGLASPEAA